MEQINSHLKQFNSLDLKKKRKLQTGQISLPLPKHKFLDRDFTCEPTFILNANAKDGSQAGTENDSSGFSKDSCSTMTEHDGFKLDSENTMSCLYDGHVISSATCGFTGDSDSTLTVQEEFELNSLNTMPCLYDGHAISSANCGSSSFMDSISSADSLVAKGIGDEKEKQKLLDADDPLPADSELQVFANLEDHLLEFQDHEDNMCSEYANDSPEDCMDKEAEDVLQGGRGNTNNTYTLSSGRWTANSESRPDTKKPTIDQEFEQYFSMLML